MIPDQNEPLQEFIFLATANLEDNIEGHRWQQYNKIALEVVLSNRSGIMADALSYWKDSGLTKKEFVYALRDMAAFTEATGKFLKATAHLANDVIPSKEEVKQ